MKNKLFTLLKFLIGWPLSLVALFFIIKLIAPQAPALLTHLKEIAGVFLIYGGCCFLVFYFLRGYIWKKLIEHTGHAISFKDACFLWASSELKRYIPGNIWSFVGRTVLFAERGVTKKDIAKSLIIEAELLVIGSATVALLSLPFLSQLSVLTLPPFVYTVLPFLVLAGILFYVFHRKAKIAHFILPTFAPIEILLLVFLSSLAFFFLGLGHYFIIASFITLDPNLVWQLTGFSVLVFLIGYLSILTPAGLGIREGGLVLGLSQLLSASAAGFVALFSRIILILSELIFVLLTFLWYKTKNKTLAVIEKWVSNHKQITILFALFVIYTVYFSLTSFLRYDNLYTGKFDLGNMSQTVWNTTQGNIFMLTDPNSTHIISRLGVHADFILILLAPFYALWPDPRNLLFVQTLVLASGTFFVYLIAKEVLKNRNLALTFSFLYLINPSIQRSNLYDFHAVVLATTFLLGAYYFLIKKRYWYFLLFAFLAGICKEQVWLIISLFGILLFFKHNKRIEGIMLFVSSITLALYLISSAIPNALGSQHFALSYFSEFGDSPLTIIKNILFSPLQTLSTLLLPERINYLKQLFSPLGYLSFFAPLFLIFAIPDLTINLLSNNAQLHQIYYQYTATITPFLFLAAIYGTSLIKKVVMKYWKNEAINVIIMIYLVALSVHGAYAFGPLPGANEPNLDMITKPIGDGQFIEKALLQIPSEARIAASNNIASHLTNRQYLFILPLGIDQADYIVFYLTPSQPAESLAIDQDLVKKYKANPNYEVVTERGILIILKRVYHGS